LTLQDALRLFHDQFPGWWWKAGERRISCDADVAINWYDVGLDGKHPDSDLFAPHRTVFDDGFSVDLRQPSTVADALLTVMEMARADRSP
jgi:hypothetical protein